MEKTYNIFILKLEYLIFKNVNPIKSILKNLGFSFLKEIFTVDLFTASESFLPGLKIAS